MTLSVRKDCLMAGSLTVQVPVQRPRAIALKRGSKGTSCRSMFNTAELRSMSFGRSNGANCTHVKTTVNMIVAIVFMIKSDEVAVYALIAVYSL